MTPLQKRATVLDFAVHMAESHLSVGREVPPCIIKYQFAGGKNSWTIIDLRGAFQTRSDKDRAAELIRQLVPKPDVDLVCLVTESWYLGPAHAGDDILPSEHPFRREAVMFYFYSRGGDIMLLADIVRPENAPAYLDAPREFPGIASQDEYIARGRFVRPR